MTTLDHDIQRGWQPEGLLTDWVGGPDVKWLFRRIAQLAVEETARGASGRVLEVAAAEAVHSCLLANRGLESFVVEPSLSMLERAREHRTRLEATVTLVRGIAETLPFADATFDRVLCDSAVDHLTYPDAGVREMARVLKPDGRRGVLSIDLGLDIPDKALRERTTLVLPRLRAAFIQTVQIYAAGMPQGPPPSVDYLSRELQRQTDVTLGQKGAKLLMGSVLMN